MRLAQGAAWGGLWVFLAACSPGAPPPTSWAIDPATREAAPGTLSGRVVAWQAGTFVPLAGAVVALDGAPGAAVADTQGGFRLSGLGPGPHRLVAALPGQIGVPLEVRPPAGAGLAGVLLLAVADGGGLARGDRTIVGLVCDPWGAALPGGTVHCVDSVAQGAAGGNRRWVADDRGLFQGVLPDATSPGEASFMAYGRLADGRAVEGRHLQTVSLGAEVVVGVAVSTHAVAGE